MGIEHQSQKIDARLSDTVLASIMMAIAVGAIIFSRDMSVMASIFPRTVAIMLLAFSSVLLAKSFWNRPQRDRPEPGSVVRRLGLVVVLLFWGLALKWLGFLVSSLVSASILVLLAHYHAWTIKRALTYTLSLALIIGCFFTLFAVILNVPLPAGLLWRSI